MKCGKPLEKEEREYCEDCTLHPLAYEQGRSLWTHSGKVMRAIYQFKFHNKRYYANVFARELARHYASWIKQCEIDAIIPVPLHPSKQRQRGYNQAGLLAEQLGEIVGVPVEAYAVRRVKKTRPQKQLDDKQRQSNLRGAFAVEQDWIPKKNVLVIDDIYTTGSTIHRISKVLRKAGVQNVYFLSISIGQGL